MSSKEIKTHDLNRVANIYEKFEGEFNHYIKNDPSNVEGLDILAMSIQEYIDQICESGQSDFTKTMAKVMMESLLSKVKAEIIRIDIDNQKSDLEIKLQITENKLRDMETNLIGKILTLMGLLVSFVSLVFGGFEITKDIANRVDISDVTVKNMSILFGLPVAFLTVSILIMLSVANLFFGYGAWKRFVKFVLNYFFIILAIITSIALFETAYDQMRNGLLIFSVVVFFTLLNPVYIKKLKDFIITLWKKYR
jgi:hypothetical protein